MISRITTWLRHAFVWTSAILAIGVAVLWVRSYWRCDEAGYFSYKPVPPPSEGYERRNLVGSYRGGIFWVWTESPAERLDWYGGEPTEIILNNAPDRQLASAALGIMWDFEPVPQWKQGGFNLHANSFQLCDNRWRFRGAVIPHWAMFLLVAWGPALRLRQRWIRRCWRKRGLCLNCGYDVRASGEVCSECGVSLQKIEPAALPLRSSRGGRWATALFVTGVAMVWFYVHGRGDRSAPVVRLGSATTLPTGQLPGRIELEIGGGISMPFAMIPSGRFLMGSPLSEAGRAENEAQREMIIGKPFYMGVTEVTQEQYEAVMGVNPSNNKGAKNPVEQVCWDDATDFCRQLSERSGHKVRLPTEAEWEYACRAGTTTPFNTGRTLPSDMANYEGWNSFPSCRKGRTQFETFPVGSFKSNAWGLYDMHGNVGEWCEDLYAPAEEPDGFPGHKYRVLRGGSLYDDPRNCRAAHREGICDVNRRVNIGFRVCLDF